MARRTSDVILQGLITGQGKEAKLRRRLELGQARNWLLALTVHAFEKLAARTPLTDLDTGLLNAYRQQGFSDDQLTAQGRLFSRLPRETRRAIFPGTFAELTPTTRYTLSDLRTDAPRLAASVRRMPTVSVIDSHAVHTGQVDFRTVLSSTNEVWGAHGSRVIVATSPKTVAPAGLFTIKAPVFSCLEESSEASDSDEVYWLFGTTAQSTTFTSKSHVFNDVDKGNLYPLPANEGNIWGPLGEAHAFPDGDMGVLISCFEHDEGHPEEVRKTFAAAFAAAAFVTPSWIGTVIEAVGGAIDAFLGLLDDDHIADLAFVFNGQTVQGLTKGGAIELGVVFTDADAKYLLTLRIARVA